MSQPIIVKLNYFRGYAGGNPTLSIDAASFIEVLNKIDEMYPGFKEVILRGSNMIRNSISVSMYNKEGRYISYVRDIAQEFPEGIKTIDIGLRDLGGG